jgi:hypothetical protein
MNRRGNLQPNYKAKTPGNDAGVLYSGSIAEEGCATLYYDDSATLSLALSLATLLQEFLGWVPR